MQRSKLALHGRLADRVRRNTMQPRCNAAGGQQRSHARSASP